MSIQKEINQAYWTPEKRKEQSDRAKNRKYKHTYESYLKRSRAGKKQWAEQKMINKWCKNKGFLLLGEPYDGPWS